MASSISRLTFLIAESSSAARQLLGRQLQDFGASNLQMTSNGQEALNILRRGGVDVVLTELNLPLVDGIELLQAMRTDPLTAKVPALILTSEKNAERLKAAINAGATQMLMKPFTIQQLETKLAATLRHVSAPPKPEESEDPFQQRLHKW